MALEQLKVREIVRQAVSKNVDIPEFQRDFVWDPDQVKLLAESLYRDYPVGSLLLWDSAAYQEAKTAQGTQASLWIVDGQQRTTALCLLFGQKPYWWNEAQDWNRALKRYDVMVNIDPEVGDDRLEFALPNPVREQDPRWIRLRQVLGSENVEALTTLAIKIVEKLVPDASRRMEVFSNVHARLQRLWQIRERDIPLVKISHEVEDVAEIFARLNQAGTRVREADVVLALTAVRNPGWVREQYLPFRNDLEERGWDLDAGIFVRTMAGIGAGRARLIEVPKDFWGQKSLPDAWTRTKDTIADCLKRLAEYGVLSASILPSGNSLIPLFVLHHRWSARPGYVFGRALRWFLLANRDGRYSGSAVTTLNEDVRAIAEASSFDDSLATLEKRLRVSERIEPEDFLERYDRAGNRFLRLMVYLLMFRGKARDWADGTVIGYDKTGSPVMSGYEPEWHHIYPRAVLRRAGVRDDDIHALANITVLNADTNRKALGQKEPWRYIRQFGVTASALREHGVPEGFPGCEESDAVLREKWNVERYHDFLLERAQFLSEKAGAFLRELKDAA
jgi:hypothetical protein